MSVSRFDAPRIGVSGHRIRARADWSFVRREIARIFRERPGGVGWSSLAIGADQVFAEVALEKGAGLVAVIPNPDEYPGEFSFLDRRRYLKTLARAQTIEAVHGPREAAFRLAGERIVDAVDLMVFVWDGEPAASEGGAGDIVDYARRRGRTSIRIDPIRKTVGPLGY